MLVEFDNLTFSVQLLADLVLVYKSYWQQLEVSGLIFFTWKECKLVENIARISEMAFFFLYFH